MALGPLSQLSSVPPNLASKAFQLQRRFNEPILSPMMTQDPLSSIIEAARFQLPATPFAAQGISPPGGFGDYAGSLTTFRNDLADFFSDPNPLRIADYDRGFPTFSPGEAQDFSANIDTDLSDFNFDFMSNLNTSLPSLFSSIDKKRNETFIRGHFDVPREAPTGVWSVIDWLNIGQWVVAGMFKDLVGGEKGFNPLKRFGYAVSGTERTSFIDVLADEYGWKRDGAGTLIAGIALDILTDPMTYVRGAGLAALGAGIGSIGGPVGVAIGAGIGVLLSLFLKAGKTRKFMTKSGYLVQKIARKMPGIAEAAAKAGIEITAETLPKALDLRAARLADTVKKAEKAVAAADQGTQLYRSTVQALRLTRKQLKEANRMAAKIRKVPVERRIFDMASTAAEQARLGQRALLSLDVPFTFIDIPLIRGAKILETTASLGRKLIDPATAIGRLGKAAQETFGGLFIHDMFAVLKKFPAFSALLEKGKRTLGRFELTAARTNEAVAEIEEMLLKLPEAERIEQASLIRTLLELDEIPRDIILEGAMGGSKAEEVVATLISHYESLAVKKRLNRFFTRHKKLFEATGQGRVPITTGRKAVTGGIPVKSLKTTPLSRAQELTVISQLDEFDITQQILEIVGQRATIDAALVEDSLASLNRILKGQAPVGVLSLSKIGIPTNKAALAGERLSEFFQELSSSKGFDVFIVRHRGPNTPPDSFFFVNRSFTRKLFPLYNKAGLGGLPLYATNFDNWWKLKQAEGKGLAAGGKEFREGDVIRVVREDPTATISLLPGDVNVGDVVYWTPPRARPDFGTAIPPKGMFPVGKIKKGEGEFVKAEIIGKTVDPNTGKVSYDVRPLAEFELKAFKPEEAAPEKLVRASAELEDIFRVGDKAPTVTSNVTVKRFGFKHKTAIAKMRSSAGLSDVERIASLSPDKMEEAGAALLNYSKKSLLANYTEVVHVVDEDGIEFLLPRYLLEQSKRVKSGKALTAKQTARRKNVYKKLYDEGRFENFVNDLMTADDDTLKTLTGWQRDVTEKLTAKIRHMRKTARASMQKTGRLAKKQSLRQRAELIDKGVEGFMPTGMGHNLHRIKDGSKRIEFVDRYLGSHVIDRNFLSLVEEGFTNPDELGRWLFHKYLMEGSGLSKKNLQEWLKYRGVTDEFPEVRFRRKATSTRITTTKFGEHGLILEHTNKAEALSSTERAKLAQYKRDNSMVLQWIDADGAKHRTGYTRGAAGKPPRLIFGKVVPKPLMDEMFAVNPDIAKVLKHEVKGIPIRIEGGTVTTSSFDEGMAIIKAGVTGKAFDKAEQAGLMKLRLSRNPKRPLEGIIESVEVDLSKLPEGRNAKKFAENLRKLSLRQKEKTGRDFAITFIDPANKLGLHKKEIALTWPGFKARKAGGPSTIGKAIPEEYLQEVSTKGEQVLSRASSVEIAKIPIKHVQKLQELGLQGRFDEIIKTRVQRTVGNFRVMYTTDAHFLRVMFYEEDKMIELFKASTMQTKVFDELAAIAPIRLSMEGARIDVNIAKKFVKNIEGILGVRAADRIDPMEVVLARLLTYAPKKGTALGSWLARNMPGPFGQPKMAPIIYHKPGLLTAKFVDVNISETLTARLHKTLTSFGLRGYKININELEGVRVGKTLKKRVVELQLAGPQIDTVLKENALTRIISEAGLVAQSRTTRGIPLYMVIPSNATRTRKFLENLGFKAIEETPGAMIAQGADLVKVVEAGTSLNKAALDATEILSKLPKTAKASVARKANMLVEKGVELRRHLARLRGEGVAKVTGAAATAIRDKVHQLREFEAKLRGEIASILEAGIKQADRREILFPRVLDEDVLSGRHFAFDDLPKSKEEVLAKIGVTMDDASRKRLHDALDEVTTRRGESKAELLERDLITVDEANSGAFINHPRAVHRKIRMLWRSIIGKDIEKELLGGKYAGSMHDVEYLMGHQLEAKRLINEKAGMPKTMVEVLFPKGVFDAARIHTDPRLREALDWIQKRTTHPIKPHVLYEHGVGPLIRLEAHTTGNQVSMHDFLSSTIKEGLRRHSAGEETWLKPVKYIQGSDLHAQTGKRIMVEHPDIAQGFTSINHPMFKGLQVDIDVAIGLKRMEGFMSQTHGGGLLDSFWRSMDKMQTWWKNWVLFAYPEFFTRNLVSSMFNAHYMGVRPDDYARAWQVYRDPSKGKGKGFIDKFGEFVDAEKAYKDVTEFRIHGKGLGAADLSKAANFFNEAEPWKRSAFRAMKEMASPLVGGAAFGLPGVAGGVALNMLFKPKWLSANRSAILHLGRRVQTTMEDVIRTATYFAGRRMGMSPEDAAHMTVLAHFDYTDLTRFEKTIKKVIPFYAWTRKNLPLQIGQTLEDTRKFWAIIKGKTVFERSQKDLIAEGLVPEWVRDNMGIPVGQDASGRTTFFLLGGWLAVADLQKLTSPIQETLNMVGPLWKTPLELMNNYSIYFRREIEKYPGEKGKFMGDYGGRLRKKHIHILRNLRALTTLDKLNPIGRYEEFGRRDPPAIRRWLKVTSGIKTHSLDEADQKRFRLKALRFDFARLKGRWKRAVTTGDTGAVEVLRGLLEDTEKDIIRLEGIKPEKLDPIIKSREDEEKRRRKEQSKQRFLNYAG